MGDDFVTAEDLQKRYRIGSVTLWRWANDSKLAFPQPLTFGRKRLWRRADISAWESQHGAMAL